MPVENADAFDEWILKGHLESLGCNPKGTSCHCPWHEDKSPSAWVKADADGHWRVMCQSANCGRKGDIYDLREQKPTSDKGSSAKSPRIASKPPPPRFLKDKAAVLDLVATMGTAEAWYKYGDPASPCLIIARVIPRTGKDKIFCPFTPKDGGYVFSKDGQKDVPLYRQHQLTNHQTVLVVEGEKSVEAAWQCGIPATTSVGGSKCAAGSDWSALAGKRVVIWPDHDAAGTQYADDVQEILTAHGCAISRIDPAGIGLEKGGDIADLAAKWPERTQRETDIILALMDDAEPQGAMSEMEEWHQKIMAGKWQSLDWPTKVLGTLSRASIPGSVTLLCADPGAGKSWLMLQLMIFWHRLGIKSAVRMFEDSAHVHMARLLAQMTGQGGHTDDAWIRDHFEQVQYHMTTHKTELMALGSRIIPETDELWSAEDLVKWAERTAKAGNRVLMIDPITAIKQGREPWLQDFELAMRLKNIAKKYECSIILTTHPRGTAREPSLIGMSGGVAWPRFSHTVLWLEMHRAPKEVRLWGGEVSAINRTMHILKCRHGKGAGASVGLNFGDDVRFSEVGILAPEQSKQPMKQQDKSPRRQIPTQPQPDEDLFGG